MLNVIIPYWICGFPKYFFGILISKGRTLRSGERETNIAEQDLRKSLKSCWPKKRFFWDGNILLPPGKASHGGGYIFAQPQLRAPSDADLK